MLFFTPLLCPSRMELSPPRSLEEVGRGGIHYERFLPLGSGICLKPAPFSAEWPEVLTFPHLSLPPVKGECPSDRPALRTHSVAGLGGALVQMPVYYCTLFTSLDLV